MRDQDGEDQLGDLQLLHTDRIKKAGVPEGRTQSEKANSAR